MHMFPEIILSNCCCLGFRNLYGIFRGQKYIVCRLYLRLCRSIKQGSVSDVKNK